jgi:hypothetical protein
MPTPYEISQLFFDYSIKCANEKSIPNFPFNSIDTDLNQLPEQLVDLGDVSKDLDPVAQKPNNKNDNKRKRQHNNEDPFKSDFKRSKGRARACQLQNMTKKQKEEDIRLQKVKNQELSKESRERKKEYIESLKSKVVEFQIHINIQEKEIKQTESILYKLRKQISEKE